MAAWKQNRLALVLVGLVVVVTGCFSVGSSDLPPTDAPDFPGYPPIAQHSDSDCHTVLLIGDSLMAPSGGAVASTLTGSGRCVTVVNTAVNGSAPAGNLEGVDWQRALPNQIAQYHPSALVIEFVGNGFTDTNGDAWLAQLETGLTDLVKTGTDAGVSTFVAVPPDVLGYPVANLTGMNRFITWQHGTDLGTPKIDTGAELSPTGFTSWLRFPDGIKRVRSDEVHLAELGVQISGYTIAAGIQDVWPPSTSATRSPEQPTATPSTTDAPSSTTPSTTSPSTSAPTSEPTTTRAP